ncbi:hypothetical protein TNCV_4164741 [Trichonephila clavipes]|nr:hypothetical protein TNCV_4164741 [Trichonephila clavipes]
MQSQLLGRVERNDLQKFIWGAENSLRAVEHDYIPAWRMPSFYFSSDVLPKRREKRWKTPQSLSRPWQRETGWGKKREAFRSSEREWW